MQHQGSCHCGRISFTVEGMFTEAIDCNCSLCRRRGGLLAFVPRDKLTLHTPREDMETFHFHKHVIDHHFCPVCGIAPFSEGMQGDMPMAAVNVRCLPDIDLDSLVIKKWDGASA